MGALALSLGVSGVVRAEPSEDPVRLRARAIAYAAIEAYAAKDFETASAQLEQSFQLVPLPSLGLWSARALVKLGRWVEADERYRVVGALVVAPSDPLIQQAAQREAAAEREELQRRIPSISIGLRGATADEVIVVLDGVRLESGALNEIHRLNPGQHSLTGVHHSTRSELIFQLEEGNQKRVWLNFQPDLAQAAAPLVPTQAPAGGEEAVNGTRVMLRKAAWVSLAASGVCLLGGSLAYMIGRRQYSDFERLDLCVTGGCSQADVDAYNASRSLSLSGLVAGGVLGAVGLGLVIATPSEHTKKRSVSLSLRLEPTAAVLGGRF